MTLDKFKRYFGEEYPFAVTDDGMRMPLHRESRFLRFYYSDEHKTGREISRFWDGSASITASELKQEWNNWPEDLRFDFCGSCVWLKGQPDFPEVLRFIMEHGSPDNWSAIALSVASELPRDEAFGMLAKALDNTHPGEFSNIGQAIAETKHPDAEATLRKLLASLWVHPALWEDADYMNWVGFDATTCICHLLELGASTSDFNAQVRKQGRVLDSPLVLFGPLLFAFGFEKQLDCVLNCDIATRRTSKLQEKSTASFSVAPTTFSLPRQARTS